MCQHTCVGACIFIHVSLSVLAILTVSVVEIWESSETFFSLVNC